MNREKYFQRLGTDRETVELVVGYLKKNGFEVNVCGSSLEGSIGNKDIDLVIGPGSVGENAKGRFEECLGYLENLGFTKLTTEVGDEILNDPRFKQDMAMYGSAEAVEMAKSRGIVFPGNFRRDMAYGGSHYAVRQAIERKEARNRQNFKTTDKFTPRKIDITFSLAPFGLNPDTKRIKL